MYAIRSYYVFSRGIDTDVFSFIDKDPEDRKIEFLYAGRISKDKNIDFLLELFVKLSKKYENIRLKLAGIGPHLKELKKKFGGHDNIEFLGEVNYDHLPKVYQSADVFLFPSVTDTFGMVVLEAHSCSYNFV